MCPVGVQLAAPVLFSCKAAFISQMSLDVSLAVDLCHVRSCSVCLYNMPYCMLYVRSYRSWPAKALGQFVWLCRVDWTKDIPRSFWFRAEQSEAFAYLTRAQSMHLQAQAPPRIFLASQICLLAGWDKFKHVSAPVQKANEKRSWPSSAWNLTRQAFESSLSCGFPLDNEAARSFCWIVDRCFKQT